MVDGESHEIASEPAGGGPNNRDQRPNDKLIDGEAVAPEAEGPAPAAPGETVAEAQDEHAPSEEPASPGSKAPGAGRALAAGAVAGAVVAALAAAAFYLSPLKASLSEADASRLSAVETATGRDEAAIASLDKRIGALEGAHTAAALASIEKRVGALETSGAASGVAGLDTRISALEAANAAESQKIEAGSRAVETLSGDIANLRASVDAARGEIPALAARVAKLETAASSADLAAVSSRIEKLEGALAAPKSETRVAPEKPSASDNPAAAAIVAETVRDKLASGAPFPTEFSALSALGVDPVRLAPLKALVDGAPTNSALMASFEAVEPKILSAAAPRESGGIGDRLLAHLRGLVQVRNLGEAAGDEPPALASQVVANLQRGDLDRALAAFARLPEPARQAASAWGAEAQKKQEALAAARSIREAAVARLAQSPKP